MVDGNNVDVFEGVAWEVEVSGNWCTSVISDVESVVGEAISEFL